MKAAVEHTFTGLTTPIASYDSTKTNLGTLMTQRTGLTATDKFAGPMPVGMTRPMEASSATTAGLIHAIPWSSDVDWVFVADNSTAAITRRIAFYEYTKSTSTFNWKGAIVLNFVTNTGVKTIRGIRAIRTLHTAGTAGASGTAVRWPRSRRQGRAPRHRPHHPPRHRAAVHRRRARAAVLARGPAAAAGRGGRRVREDHLRRAGPDPRSRQRRATAAQLPGFADPVRARDPLAVLPARSAGHGAGARHSGRADRRVAPAQIGRASCRERVSSPV